MIISMVRETLVTDKIRPHSYNIINLMKRIISFIMQQQGGFFDIEITDEFVQSLDDLTFTQLILILKDNFQNQYRHCQEMQNQIDSGGGNIKKLTNIKQNNMKQRLRLNSELEILQTQCEKLKIQLKQPNRP